MFKILAIEKLKELNRYHAENKFKSVKEVMYAAAADSVRHGGSEYYTTYEYKDKSTLLVLRSGHCHVGLGHVQTEEGKSIYVDEDEQKEELSTRFSF